jgi:hypothetical protein
MKEQKQLTGIRKWFGDDFLMIQSEIITAMEAFFYPYGACVIEGCGVTGQNIASGIVYVGGKIVRFAGTTGVSSFPVYLELNESISKTRTYETGGVKEIERDYKAVLNISVPSGDYITITSTGGKLFLEAIQNSTHRFATDTEKNTWNTVASAYTAADVLAKLLTVDGIGTGLDADLLDGNHASVFALLAGAVFTGSLAGQNGIVSEIETKLGTSLPSTYPFGLSTLIADTSQSGWPIIGSSTKMDGLVLTLKTTNICFQLFFEYGIRGAIYQRAKSVGADTWKSWYELSGWGDTVVLSGSSNTISASHHGKVLTVGSTMTITIPSTLPYGFKCDVVSSQNVTVTFTAGSGTSLYSKGSANKLAVQYGAVTILSADGLSGFYLFGDISN